MLVYEPAQVKIAGRVSADDQEIGVAEYVHAGLDSAGRTQGLGLDSPRYVNSKGLSVAEVVHDGAGVVTQGGADVVYSVFTQQLDAALH